MYTIPSAPFANSQRLRVACAALFVAALLTACGGGGGPTDSNNPNALPTAATGGSSDSAAAPSTSTPSTSGGSSSSPSTAPSSGSASSPSGTGTVSVAAATFAANSSGTPMPILTTPPVNTPSSGNVILVQLLTQNTGTLAGLSDNMGNTYTQVGQGTYAGAAGTYLYVCQPNCKGGSGQRWSLTKTSGYGDNEASLYVVVLSGASGLGPTSFSNTRSYDSASPITTTAANSIVVSFWGPADYTGTQNVYTPPAGWTLGGYNGNAVDQNSGAFAWSAVAAAGTQVNPTWSAKYAINDPTGSMWLAAVNP